jgi:hypothetical protein
MGGQHHALAAFTQERPGTHFKGGWVGFGAGLDRAENLAPTGIRSPDLPARSESLYRLHHPGSSCQIFINLKFSHQSFFKKNFKYQIP